MKTREVFKSLDAMREATPQEIQGIDTYIDEISHEFLSIPIDKDTTNEDMLKILFPYLDFTGVVAVYNNCCAMRFNYNWLKSKYDKEGE